MSATLSSKRYAQAAFEIAKDNNKLEEWISHPPAHPAVILHGDQIDDIILIGVRV